MSDFTPTALPAAQSTLLIPKDVSAGLAQELALAIEAPSVIFKRRGITDVQAKKLLANTVFAAMVKDARTSWESSGNTESRIRTKAAVALEEMMPSMYAMGVDMDTGPSGRNEVFKTFKSLSGMDKKEDAANGSRFILNINLGGKEDLQIDTAVIEGSDL